MMTRDADKKRSQMLMFCMDDMVPQDHLLRKIDRAIDWNFIYDLVEDKYCADNGRPNLDPVLLIKIVFIQYLYGIRSMRQTIREIEVNVAYRWFQGLDILDGVPHFSTFGKNYTRWFKGTDLFEQIFSHILEECMKYHLVDTSVIFADATHVKACANSKKMRNRIAKQEALWYEEELKQEINEDRKAHGKKHLKDKNDHNQTPPSVGGGNLKTLYDKLLSYHPEMMVLDAGYKTPAIAHLLIEDQIEPLFPYKSPQTKKGFFRKYEYVYDEYYDCYICPEGKILTYSTTNRDGYREYKSNCRDCKDCPSLSKCTESKEHVKIVTRHIWAEYLEKCEDIRHTIGNKEIYDLRKETIERIFGTAKEQHGFRYTQYKGKARMEMKVGLTYACMNLKKLVKILAKKEQKVSDMLRSFIKATRNFIHTEKWCWSLTPAPTLSTV